jgi:hypothetical protein
MKHLKTFESFGEPINEGFVDALLEISDKALGLLLMPFIKVALFIVKKSTKVEFKWKVIQNLLDAKVAFADEIKDIKKKLEVDDKLSPNEKRDLLKKVNNFNKQYPNGFKLSELKAELLKKSEKVLKESGEKGNEDWEWFKNKLEKYEATSKKSFRGALKKLETIDGDFIVK